MRGDSGRQRVRLPPVACGCLYTVSEAHKYHLADSLRVKLSACNLELCPPFGTLGELYLPAMCLNDVTHD